jgi:hypothetical protein
MEITSTVKCWDFDYEDHSYYFEFTFKYGDLKSVVRIDEPYICKLDEWYKMYNAIKDGEKCHLSFYQGNGEGTMSCDGLFVTFTAQPSGAGGDISVDVSIPLESHKELFLQNLNDLLSNPIVLNYNKPKN